MSESRGVSRRRFLFGLGIAPLVPTFFHSYRALAAPAEKQVKITNVQTMVMQGPRTYTLVKVSTDAGIYGIAEAYGSPGVGVKEQVLFLKSALLGKDPLQIDAIITGLGNRTDGSAHQLMRAVSGIEMALWDLSGKILDVPTWKLLGGKFRDRVRVYDHAGPRNMLDKVACADWAAAVKGHASGCTCHKFGIQTETSSARGGRGGRGAGPGTAGGGDGDGGGGRDGRGTAPGAEAGGNGDGGAGRNPFGAARTLSPRQLVNVQKGFDNVREAIGWERDFMVHGQWGWDVRTSVDLSEALAASKPIWLEDPLPVEYTDSWKRLTEESKVPICTGENLARREGFLDFILHQGADILHPDLRNTGGFLETKRIADVAHVFGMPMANHNTGSQVNTYASAQWAASIHDYIALETITGAGDWMDKVLLLDGPYIKDGHIQVTEKSGLGIELNPDVVRAHLAPGETWWG
jgi:L-alanine-DL-glutamate epimerase-like enolase superfamily enzyme